MKGAGGMIDDGREIAYTTYDYNQEGILNDFPQFRFRKEWWLGKTDADGMLTPDPTAYEYSRTTDASTEVTTITYHGKDCKEVTTMGTDIGQLNFGKVISVELKKNTPQEEVLSRHVFTYTTGPDGGTQIETIETFDEEEQGTLVRFGYGPYGRVINKYEYGYKQGDSFEWGSFFEK